MAVDTVPARLLAAHKRFGNAPAYWVRGENVWRATSWAEYVAEVRAAARALIALGLQPTDSVAILGFNRPEWSTMAHAAMLAGGKVVGVYWTSSAEEVDYVVRHAEAKILLVEDAAQDAKLSRGDTASPLGMAPPSLSQRIAMRGARVDGALSWEEFLAKGSAANDAEIDTRLAALTPESIACLIYTSGTTGHPKAVQLAQKSLTFVADALVGALGSTAADKTISYLPLAHIAEQMVNVHAQATSGYQIYYAKSIEALGDALKEVHPTIFFAVPRVWERMQKAITDKLAVATGLKPKLARAAMALALKGQEMQRAGKQPGIIHERLMKLASKAILNKVKEALGLDQARWTYSGAAPISADTLRFFAGLDLSIREVYGLSETCGPATLGLSPTTPIGSVGQALPGMKMKIAEDGELLMKGANIFAGYFKRPEATAEVLVDGWFHSGDLASIDESGNVFITGRKKDILITSGGKNISPANIEADLATMPLIEHAIVCGDGRHFLTALITLAPEALASFAAERKLTGHLHQHPEVLAAVQQGIDQVNERHARVANVRKFTLLDKSLSVDGGHLTATMKVRRQRVLVDHQSVIDAMYKD